MKTIQTIKRNCHSGKIYKRPFAFVNFIRNPILHKLRMGFRINFPSRTPPLSATNRLWKIFRNGTVYYVFILLFLAISPAHAEELNSRSWDVNDAHSLYNYSPTPGEVGNFVNELVDADWNMPLCSFKFIDVFDGSYRLVASLDTNGRHTCNKLIVVEKSGSHFNIVNNLQVIGAGNVSDWLQDLDNDHSPEMIVTQAWSRPETGHCLATWQHIYKWHEGRFTDQSASFPHYYKDRREQLIAGLRRESDITCHQMEIDKISRLLGAPDAGFDRAVAWMKGPDESLRRKAATVFADIGDAKAKKNLAMLAKAPDPLTAKSAQLYLDSP